MSESTIYQFLSLLKTGNVPDLIAKYYDDNVKFLSIGKTETNRYWIDVLEKKLRSFQVLQFNVADIKFKKDVLSYGIYLVVKDEDNLVEFSKHEIINKWNNNLVCVHKHKITYF